MLAAKLVFRGHCRRCCNIKLLKHIKSRQYSVLAKTIQPPIPEETNKNMKLTMMTFPPDDPTRSYCRNVFSEKLIIGDQCFKCKTNLSLTFPPDDQAPVSDHVGKTFLRKTYNQIINQMIYKAPVPDHVGKTFLKKTYNQIINQQSHQMIKHPFLITLA